MSLKIKQTPLQMLVELCRPCQFYCEESLPDRKTVKPSCRIGRQQVCMNAGIIYVATRGSDSNPADEKTLSVTKDELRFLRQLLDVYFQSFNWRRASPFQTLADNFSGCSLIFIPDGVLRKIEKALEE